MERVPETLVDWPEIEYLDGRAYPKMSPRRTHGRLQLFLASLLEVQGGAFGQAVPEWRCAVGEVDQSDTIFVPDVAWAGNERLERLSDEDTEIPPFAPDIAIEIRSPGENLGFLRTKIERYLRTGSSLVLDVDPKRHQVVAHSAAGEQTFALGDRFDSDAFPWFTFEVTALFASAARPKR